MTHTSPFRRAARGLIVACFGVALAFPALRAHASNDSSKFHWRPVEEAQLKIGDKPPLKWNVYQPEKKKESNLLLILIGHRYISLDTKAKLAYLVIPTDLHAQGQDFESDDLRNASRVIPSENWSVRDVGPATSIRFTLKDYGSNTIDVELPHPIDFRAVY
ncbi:MAG: hypothetical protein ACRD4S_17715 [Candidatus Acidiferrales bacterium]